MKRLLGALFVMVIMFFSTSLMVSANSPTLYNKGEAVELENAIIRKDYDYFISLDDLEAINIGYKELDEYSLVIGKLKGYYKSYVYLEEKIIDGNVLYENAVLIENDKIYLSITAIAETYSEHISFDFVTDKVSLWINDYVTDTFWLNYSIDESIEIDENGLTVDLYYGSKKNVVYYSGGGRPLPEEKGGVDISSIPSESDVHKLANTTIKNRKTHTFTDEDRIYTLTYDVVSRVAVSNGGISSNDGSSSGGSSSGAPVAGGGFGGGGASSGNSRVAGIIVDTDKYLGGVQTYYSYSNTADIVLTENNIFDFVSVKGSITVPIQEKDLGYTVVAEGQRIENRTSLGTYYVQRKHVDSYSGIISAGESGSTYELKLVPNQDYVVYIRFDNGEYIRQYVEYEDLVEDKILNFADFKKSKVVSGKIKLPNDISSLTGVNGGLYQNISGTITLQSDNRPYYIVDATEFTLDLESKSCDFILADDIGMNNGYIHFRLHDDLEEVYSAGVYVDNTNIGYVIQEASIVSTDTQDLIITLAKGKTIETVVEYNAENYSVGVFYALVQDETKKTDFDGTLLYVYGNRVNSEYDLDEPCCKMTYKAVIPYDKANYISCLLFQYGNYEVPLYYDAEIATWVDDFSKSDIISDASINKVFAGYKPAVAVKVRGNIDDNTTGLMYNADYTTIGDFEYLGATRYVAYYGEDNRLLHLETFPADFRVGYVENNEVELNQIYYEIAEEVKMFIWHENLKPIAEITKIK